MTVFFYDKTFEGVLSAVFDAYNHKLFPDHLLKTGEIAPMFCGDTHPVITQESKSNRVWNALERKLSKPASNMLIHVWLSEEVGSDQLLFRYICKTLDAHHSIETNFADPDVLEMHQIAKRVTKEKGYLMQFLRFQKTADGIFFAPLSPVCNVLPLAIGHFTDRFADQQWVIYDVKRKYGYYYDLHKVEEITFTDDTHLQSGRLADNLIAEDEKVFQQLWREYFNALSIRERMNPRLHRQQMPVRFWKFLPEKQGGKK